MDCWHVTLGAWGRLAAFGGAGIRDKAVRRLVDLAGPGLALFCVMPDHVHLVLAADRHRVGRLCQRVSLSLGALAGRRLQPASIRPVDDRSHLDSLVRYVLRQVSHHGLPDHPALWSGSVFQDLAGAR